jgi:hypothetical protein
MNVILAVLLNVLLTIMNTVAAPIQDWQWIVPLKTTRTEVERILGPTKTAYYADYQLNDGALFIEYSSGPCRPDRKGGWDVPENVVVSMSFSPKHHQKLSALKLDSRKYRKVIDPELPSVTYYINEVDGITYSIQSRKVDYVEYGPAKKYDDLYCKE